MITSETRSAHARYSDAAAATALVLTGLGHGGRVPRRRAAGAPRSGVRDRSRRRPRHRRRRRDVRRGRRRARGCGTTTGSGAGPARARFYRWRAAAARRRLGARRRGGAARHAARAARRRRVVALLGMLLTLVGLGSAATRRQRRPTARWIEALFAPAALPTIIPRLVVLAACWWRCAAALVASSSPMRWREPARRRASHGIDLAACWAGRCRPRRCCRRSSAELWNLIRGAAPLIAAAGGRSSGAATSSCSPRISASRGSASCCSSCTTWTRGATCVRAAGAGGPAALLHAVRRPDGGDARRPRRSISPASRASTRSTRSPAPLRCRSPPSRTCCTFAPEGPWRGETHRRVRSAGRAGAAARGGRRRRRRAGDHRRRPRRRRAGRTS